MKRQATAAVTGALVAGLTLLAAPAQARQPDPCQTLRYDVVEEALDYALLKASEGDLAEMSNRTNIDISTCERQSRRRAVWRYRLTIRDWSRNVMIREEGTVMVTRRRATWTPDPAISNGLG